MTVTIIGSYSCKEKMADCQKFFEAMGATVYSPIDPGREDMTLIQKQLDWFYNISISDLIVAIPKYMHDVIPEKDKGTKIEALFGESTSYEMAIAYKLNKQVIIF